MQGFGNNIKSSMKLAGTALAAGAAAGIGLYMKDAVTQASNLNEAMSATSQVFGDAFGDIEKYAKQGAMALGQTRTQVYDAARQFGIFGNAAGLAARENAKFSTNLVGLATDLASFNNTSVDQAITALAAGLRGESESLRQYGVLLDEATLRQKALAIGIVKTTKDALTPQQRVLAANAAIMEQTSMQQGDFARTSKGLANQQRIFNAQLAEIKVNLGEAFLPIVNMVMPILNSFASTLSMVTSRIGGFFSSLFGNEKQKKTAKQTKQVNNQAIAYNNLNKEIKGAGKSAKGTLASFDSINTISESGGTSSNPIVDDLNQLQQVIDGSGKTIDDNKSKIEAFRELVEKSIKNDFKDSLKELGNELSVWGKGFKNIFDGFDGFNWSDLSGRVVRSFTGITQQLTGTMKMFRGLHDLITGFFSLDWNRFKAGSDTFLSGFGKSIQGLTNYVLGVNINFNKVFTKDIPSYISKMWDESQSKKALEGMKQLGLSAYNGFKEGMKGFANILKNIKLPKFKFNNWSLNPVNWVKKMPSISIDWYAQGGVFDKASVIGVGENGREAVMPLENNTGWITELASKLNAQSGTGDIVINVGGTTLARITANEMNRLNRQAGRTVLNV